MEIWAQWARADLALGHGDVATARERYVVVAGSARRAGHRDVDLSPVPEIVECLRRLGRAADAIEPVAAYAARATAKGQPWALARAARALAADAGDAEVDDAYGIALAAHERHAGRLRAGPHPAGVRQPACGGSAAGSTRDRC